MQITFGSKIYYENNFSPLKNTQTVKAQWTYFKFYDENDKYIGKFDLLDEGSFYLENNSKAHLGYITGLEILKGLRGKKVAINLLYNIKKIALEKAIQKNMSIIHFAAANDNPNNVAKLYKRLFPNAIWQQSDCHTRFAVPVKETSRQNAQQLLDDFGMIYRNIIFENELDLPPRVNNSFI